MRNSLRLVDRPVPVSTVDQPSGSPYLRTDEAAAYYRFPSTEAFRKWCYRHQVVIHHGWGRQGRVLRADIEAQQRRRIAPVPVRRRA